MLYDLTIKNYGPLNDKPLLVSFDTETGKVTVGVSQFIDVSQQQSNVVLPTNQAIIIAKQVAGQLRLASYDMNVAPFNSVRLHKNDNASLIFKFDVNGMLWEYQIDASLDPDAPDTVKENHSDIIVNHEVLLWTDFAGDKHVEFRRDHNNLFITPEGSFFDLHRLGELWSYRPALKHGTVLNMFLITLPSGSVEAMNTYSKLQDVFHQGIFQLVMKNVR